MTQPTLRDRVAIALLEIGTVYSAMTIGQQYEVYKAQATAILDTVAQGGNPALATGSLAWLVLPDGRAMRLSSLDEVYMELGHDAGIAKAVWRAIAPTMTTTDRPGVAELLARHTDALQYMGQL